MSRRSLGLPTWRRANASLGSIRSAGMGQTLAVLGPPGTFARAVRGGFQLLGTLRPYAPADAAMSVFVAATDGGRRVNHGGAPTLSYGTGQLGGAYDEFFALNTPLGPGFAVPWSITTVPPKVKHCGTAVPSWMETVSEP